MFARTFACPVVVVVMWDNEIMMPLQVVTFPLTSDETEVIFNV